MRKKPNYLFLLSIVFLLGFLVWNYHSSWVVGQLSIDTVRQGQVRHEKTVKAVFANTEIVLTAPIEGKITMIREEGQKYGKGETLVSLIPVGVNNVQSKKETIVTTPISGLFYSYLDGLEQVVTPENFMNMDLSGLLVQLDNQVTNSDHSGEKSTEVISKHSPVGKIVNNLYPSWVFIYLESTDTMEKGNIVRLVIDNEEYSGTVMKVSGEPKGAVVRLTQYIKGTTENRKKDVIWKFKPASNGLLVPVTALCTFGEERGVYIGEQGVIRFRNVQVLDYNEVVARVEGIPEGSRVISNPRRGIEGLPIKK